jgi:hypothetical protein
MRATTTATAKLLPSGQRLIIFYAHIFPTTRPLAHARGRWKGVGHVTQSPKFKLKIESTEIIRSHSEPAASRRKEKERKGKGKHEGKSVCG